MATITRKNQRGSVLLWGMVILLTLTVIGFAATRMASVDNKIAGNQMMYMLTFEGADTMLRRSISLYNVMQTAQSGTSPSEYSKDKVKVLQLSNFAENISGINAAGQTAMGEEEGCPPLKGVAMTTEMTPDAGGIACRVFTTDASASLTGTGARSRHSEGVLKPVPKVH
ncbi:PilX N-terminal domain-containing pilus assembly protein [Candidatus Thiothrix sp. Deng01]|uniref:PilX N-terminal domain-containing pilus assembly protein n=1 Tax=Candidatus Thiothrix phosphatis TaxID=3112415 RepID=A0ABU6D219_9GAMM|nr:PilX N-terminal domain-containing pilus assembly protein [Candidatus Thiothrix sp. Deng01]MEB4592383.1 PilX N-terminal domain-containing pilus assembly protein [Candidatus Thiothrix sp. Deng01]